MMNNFKFTPEDIEFTVSEAGIDGIVRDLGMISIQKANAKLQKMLDEAPTVGMCEHDHLTLHLENGMCCRCAGEFISKAKLINIEEIGE